MIGNYWNSAYRNLMKRNRYFLYFALFAESFLDILQVCSASGEDDSGE